MEMYNLIHGKERAAEDLDLSRKVSKRKSKWSCSMLISQQPIWKRKPIIFALLGLLVLVTWWSSGRKPETLALAWTPERPLLQDNLFPERKYIIVS